MAIKEEHYVVKVDGVEYPATCFKKKNEWVCFIFVDEHVALEVKTPPTPQDFVARIAEQFRKMWGREVSVEVKKT